MSQCSNSAARVSRLVSCSRIQLGERRNSCSYPRLRLPTRTGTCGTLHLPSLLETNTTSRHLSHYQKQHEQRQSWQEFTDQIIQEEIRHEPLLGNLTFSDTTVENSTNDKEATMKQIRQWTHLHIHAAIEGQQVRLKDKWESYRSEVILQFEHPKPLVEEVVTSDDRSTSSNETLKTKGTYPFLKNFEEFIPTATMNTTLKKESSPLIDVPKKPLNHPENTRYHNHLPSLMDLLNQPMPSFQEASRQSSELCKEAIPQSKASSLMDLLNSDDIPNTPTLLMDLWNNESHQPPAWKNQHDTPAIKKMPSLMDLLEETNEVDAPSSPVNSWNSQSVRSSNTLSDMDWSKREAHHSQSIDSNSREQWSSKVWPLIDGSSEHTLTSNTVFADGLALLSIMSNKEWKDGQRILEAGSKTESEKHQIQQRITVALKGEEAMSTEESNLLLMYLGTLPMYDFDEALTTISQLYMQRIAKDAADSCTHSIVLTALSRKGQGMSSSLNLVRSLMEKDIQWTEHLINQAMYLIEQHRCVAVGESLINKLKSQSINIPFNANISLLKLYKAENMQGKAMAIVNNYAEVGVTNTHVKAGVSIVEVKLTHYIPFNLQTLGLSEEMNTLLLQTVDWPNKVRTSHAVDRLPLFKELFMAISKLFTGEPTGQGGVPLRVWQRLLTGLWREVQRNEKHNIAGTVKEGFRLLREDHPNFPHTGMLFKVGLEVAGLTRDSGLAKALLFKYIKDNVMHAGREYDSRIPLSVPVRDESKSVDEDKDCNTDVAHLGTDEDLFEAFSNNEGDCIQESASNKFADDLFVDFEMIDEENKPDTHSVVNRPTKFFIAHSVICKVLEIALSARDLTCVHEILASLDGKLYSMPASSINHLYSLAIKGCASIGEPDDAIQLLNKMKELGFCPCEVTCGAVILSLAHSNRTAEATAFFEDVSWGRFSKDLKPGLACYNGYMLSLMKMKAWGDVLSIQQSMREAGISPDPSTFHGVLIASMRSGGKSVVLSVVEDAVKNGMKINRECIDLIMRGLLSDLNLRANAIPATRETLRALLDERDGLQNEYLDLIRTLRIAELEDSREASYLIRAEQIKVKQECAWQAVLNSLVNLAKKKYELAE